MIKLKKRMALVFVITLCISTCFGCGNVEKVETLKPQGGNIESLAVSYTEYIAKKFPDRDSTNENSNHNGAKAFIIAELKADGYKKNQIECQDFKYNEYSGSNIVLTVEGQDSSKQVIVGGHYDGDGIGDNGSAIALMLATAKNLKDKKPLYTVKYVFFDCEEIGCLGSTYYAESLSEEEAKNTVYMVNIDSILFGDYCNVYGGDTNHKTGEVTETSAYELACKKAAYLGMDVWGTKELDGYFAEHKTGPDIKENTIYTNPWTKENPAPNSDLLEEDLIAYAPSTIPYSDHVGFVERGIPYIYFEATNWFAAGNEEEIAYTGYVETYDSSIGEGGMFMNTEYDTIENLKKYFPGRMEAHYSVYGQLLSSLILNPESELPEAK